MYKHNLEGVKCEQSFGLFWMNRYPFLQADIDGYCLSQKASRNLNMIIMGTI